MSYRKKLIESIKELHNIRVGIFTQIINLSMSQELNDIDKSFDIGEVFHFDIKHFEDSKDINVTELVRLFKNIDETVNTLLNINSISHEELVLE
jgi:hypothetical protein